MGQEIVYCYNCKTRLLASEFEKGEAFLLRERPCCRLCVIQLLPMLTPEEQQTLTTSRVVKSTPKPKRVVTPPPAPPPAAERKLLIPIAAASAGLAILVVLVVVLRPADEKREPAKPIEMAIELPPDPVPVRGPLDEAREYRKRHPEDLAGQIRAYKKILWELEGTPHVELAKGELAPLLHQRRAILDQHLRELEAELREKFYDKEYEAVLQGYRDARRRFEESDWAELVDAKISEIKNGISDYYSAAKEKAKQSGDPDRVEALRREIARWGIEWYRTDFESAFPPAREHVISASHLRASGTFKRAGRHWVSDQDSDARVRRENYVEAEFEAMANVRYRCYVYVGGCCQETMALFIQGSEMAGVGNGERRSIEPGSAYYLFKGHPRPIGPKTHSEHGGEKQPTTWEWRLVDLPLYATSGRKKLRILTNSKGLAVAGLIITSQKYWDGPPTEAGLFNDR
jgi:hypothetical protein